MLQHLHRPYQDRATAHTAKSISYLFTENNLPVKAWCAQSPDLNLIKNIWSCMDRKMVTMHFTSAMDLQEKLDKTWLDIPHGLCMKLVKSMPKCVRPC